jgi:hypothetical protein
VSALDYQIVVPSRKRAHNMELIRRLLPTALICVDERERWDYAPFVPDDRLLLHPPMDGLYNVINWMQAKIASKVLVEIDDDFQCVRGTTGSMRRITSPTDILAIVENAARCCTDLGLTTFCWSRTANTAMLHAELKPVRPVQPVCNAFGMMGDARHRPYAVEFLGRGDVDWTLRTLLEDRCVYADCRFYFDCGRVFGGRGGNVGLVTPATFKRTSVELVRKWGRHVSYRAPAFQKNRSVAAISIKVSRTNPTAQR